MSLTQFQGGDTSFQLMQNSWASDINPIIKKVDAMGSTITQEFVFNSSTNDANDTSSFGYGPQGTPVVSALTTERLKRVRFKNKIEVTDLVLIEVFDSDVSDSTSWLTLTDGRTGVVPLTYQSTITYGIGLRPVAGSQTDLDVDFGRYSFPSGATYASAGNAWNSSMLKWRIRKISFV